MQKLLLMSVLIATFVIPVLVAKQSDTREYGVVLARLAAFVAVYIVLLLFVYPRLS